MDERCIANMLDESDDAWSSDDYSEIDDTDADADFILENSDSETSVENYTDQSTASQNVNNQTHEQVNKIYNTLNYMIL